MRGDFMPKNLEIGYVKRDYDTNKGIGLPNVITYYNIDGENLFIAPEKASWITVNEIGKNFIKNFRKGFSIKDVVAEMQSRNFSMEEISSELRNFLIKVEKAGFLENAKVKEEDPETTFQLYLTSKCNGHCIHCYIDAGSRADRELDTDEFLRLLDQCGNISKSKVTFTGGEPLLRADFFELAERAKKNSFEVNLFTNGTLIDEKMVSKLEKSVDEIQFGLDGATPDVNDKIRGKGVYNKVLKAIQLLRDTQIKLKIAVVIMPQNIDDFRENLETLSGELENVDMKFGLAINEGRANKTFRFSSETEGEIALQEILKILYQKRLKRMRNIEPNLISRNCGYGEIITVFSNGDVYPCGIPKQKYGNIRIDNFLDLVRKIKEDMIAFRVENLEDCPKCDLKYICFGGCRLNNITFNGSPFKPNCSAKKKEDFYRKLIRRANFDGLAYWLDQDKKN
jgi:radical SAM protein with 4Fe4S-binding SPASM domain